MDEFVREIKEAEADRILREAEVSDDNQECGKLFERLPMFVILGIILCMTFVIERRVALLNETVTLRDSTILRMQKYDRFRDSIMWKHIEQTDSMHIEAIKEMRRLKVI